MSQAGLNRIWAQAVLETLVTSGVKHVCIAPGSRSTPLSLEALELSQRSDLELHTHFDERGLGFFALGIAKATQAPVAVVVTSGTAVANLLPSVCESGLIGEKLILLTSDRPQSLIAVGANQAIVQKGIFSSHVRKSIELCSPNAEPQLLTQALVQLNQALTYQSQVSGSIHVNCPYPEPLYIQNEAEKAQHQVVLEQALSELKHYAKLTVLYPSYRVAEIENGIQQAIINQAPNLKGMVLIGKMPLADAEKVKEWAEKCGWPVLADPQSGVSSDWAHYDLWLQHQPYFEKIAEVECIFQFGARFVSKRIGQLIKQVVTEKQCHYWVFDPNISVLNPDRLPQQRTVAPILESVSILDYAFERTKVTTSGWAEEMKCAAIEIKNAALPIRNNFTLTECQLALLLPQLIKQIPETHLFIGNSLIVRLIDMLSALNKTPVYSNRGASGIDGLVATAAGVQVSLKTPLLTLVGDTSLLYDLNSLALLSQVSHPHIVIVTNNDGGAIFDLLPVPKTQKQYLYQMPHGYQFEHAAYQFKLQYTAETNWDSLLVSIQQYLDDFKNGDTQSALLVEVITPPEQASQQIKTILSEFIKQSSSIL